MRRLLSALTVAASASAYMAVPVLSLPGAHVHPVSASYAEVPVQAAATPDVLGSASSARHFDIVGARWRTGTFDQSSTRVEISVHQHGRWSGWQALEPTDGGPDGGTADARRAARLDIGPTQSAEPVWVGDSDAVRARVVGVAGRTVPQAAPSLPTDLDVVLVDGGTSSADSDPGPTVTVGADVADAAVGRPQIYTRADWGADESLRKKACPGGPDYSPTIKMGFVHHTDGTNGYTRAQVPGIIRGIYAYHVKANGWCDVGYNFLVDRFGRIWEGRYGGITKAVIGAHTGGYNYDTFAASLIGNYGSVQPSAAMLDATAKLFAWKLSRTYRDPLGRTMLTAASFSGSRYAEGTDVTFNTIAGHRDADYTTCPGTAAYRDLGDLRTRVQAAMGAGFVQPTVSTATARMADGVITADSKVVAKQSWTLTVVDAAGATVKKLTGAATRRSKVAASWDLTDAQGLPVLPGTYTMTLTGSNADGALALPWTSTVTVTPPVSLRVPTQTSYSSAVTPRGAGIPGHEVDVTVRGPSGTQTLAPIAVNDAGHWKAPAAVDAGGDLTWTVTDPAASGYSRTRTTRVGPTLTAPTDNVSFVPAGSAIAVAGTALPGSGSPVSVLALRAGATSSTAVQTVSVQSGGGWSASLTPAAPTTFWARDHRGLESSRRTVYPVSDPDGTAPTTGYAGRAVRITGNAGKAPVPVTLSTRQDGTAWTAVRTVTATTDGHFSLRMRLPDTAGNTVRWRISTAYGSPATGSVQVQPTFRPTVTGPARVAWNSIHLLSGKAVPGDAVTIWTAPLGSTRWTEAGTVRAAADKSWSFPLTFTRDRSWRVTSASGRSKPGSTVIVPTVKAPRTAKAKTAVTLRGRGIPNQSLTVWRRDAGDGAWAKRFTVKIHGDGTWSVTAHPRADSDYRVVSHGQTSRAVTVDIV